eukprot:1152901-Pelagomonas_calceolata.AAC.3
MVGSHIKKLSAGASPGSDARMLRVVLRKARILLEGSKTEPAYNPHEKGAMPNPGNYRMIAVSGMMYCIYANVLKDLVTDWHVQNKVPDNQFGFYPGRSTLHPLFTLRHLKNAAKKLKPQQSPRLHAAFIDFSQAHDTVPRLQLWDHLQRIAMPALLLQAIKDMYKDDECILMDGNKRARVQPACGVKQGCPLSPLLFSVHQ